MLPFLFSLGLPALAPTLGMTGLSGATLAGIGAGLGSFLETGDVGKGIKTGLTSFLGGKILSGMGGAAAAKTPVGEALGGVNPAMASQEAFAEALGKLPAENAGFLQTTLTDTIGQEAAAGLMQPGILNTAYLGQTAADLYNPPEFEDPRKDQTPPPEPLPPIRTAQFRDRSEDDGSSEFNYFDYYRPDRGYKPDSPYLYNMGGIVGFQQATHPMFSGLQMGITQALNKDTQQKVAPFIQKVEQDARAEFGDEVFQTPQISNQTQVLDPGRLPFPQLQARTQMEQALHAQKARRDMGVNMHNSGKGAGLSSTNSVQKKAMPEFNFVRNDVFRSALALLRVESFKQLV